MFEYKDNYHEPYDINKNQDFPRLKPKVPEEEHKEADFSVLSHERVHDNKTEEAFETKFENLNIKEPNFHKFDSKDFEKRLTFGNFDSKASPQKIDQSRAFRENLPHHKDKNPLLVVESKITHNFMEDRVEKQDLSITQNDLKLDMEKPTLNSQNLQQTNFFSKHIFEDKVIMQVLQKKTGKNYYQKEVIVEEKDVEKEKGDGKIVLRRAGRDYDVYIKFLHVTFKLLTVLFYLMLGDDQKSKNFMYQAVVFFISIDFWVVKNISARYGTVIIKINIKKQKIKIKKNVIIYFAKSYIEKYFDRFLIEMRYWCEFDNKGREFWVFETINDREVLPNRGNHVFFWVIQGFFVGAYIVITIYELVLLRFAMVFNIFLIFNNLIFFNSKTRILINNFSVFVMDSLHFYLSLILLYIKDAEKVLLHFNSF